MVLLRMLEVFTNAEVSYGGHPRLIQHLMNIYNECTFDTYVDCFVKCLQIIFNRQIEKSRKPFKSLDLAAQFTAKLMYKAESESMDEDFDTPPFISKIILETLKYTYLVPEGMRYYSCQFINLVLKHLKENAELDDDLYVAIQDAMLDAVNDRIPAVRLQAIYCLVRLQDPLNNECPVIKAYMTSLVDPNVALRCAAVKTIAVTAVTIPKLVKCLYDRNHQVRCEATLKCAHINPIYFRIQDRQKVLFKLFNEEYKLVKKCFNDVLFPKWLAEYNNDILRFLKCIKLEGDDSDIKTVGTLTSNILELYFTSFPINEIIDVLLLGDDKLIPYDKLSMESVAYWNSLIKHLKKNDLDDYLDDLLPELLHFANYIEKIVADNIGALQSKKMDDWQMLEFQYKLNILMEIAGGRDLADEVGRKALHKLILKTLKEIKLHTKTTLTMMRILSGLHSTPQDFTLEVCTLISEIREPEEEEEAEEDLAAPPPDLALNFKVAQMKLKLDLLSEEILEAKNDSKFEVAAEKYKEQQTLSLELEALRAKPAAKAKVKVKRVQNDIETICQYLDIFIVMLQVVRKLDDNLQSCFQEVLYPLMDSSTEEVCLRVFKSNGLIALLDREYALANIKMIATPVIMFHYMSNYDQEILIAAIGAITDMVVIYGINVLGDEANSTVQKKNVRRLYNQGEYSLENLDVDEYSSEEIFNIIIEIMDDENSALSEVAVNAVGRLMMAGALVTPGLVSRVLLKYLNPLMEKNEPKLHQMLLSGLLYFASKYNNAVDVIAKAVFPTLNMILNAPKTNPLSEIDLDSTINFMAGLTNNAGKDTIVNAHQELCLNLCTKLVKNPNDKCSGVWIKMLLVLQLPTDDKVVLNEIKQQLEIIIEEISDKALMQKLKKHLANLIEILNADTLTMLPDIAEESGNNNTADVEEIKNKATDIEEVASQDEESAFVVPGSSLCDKVVVLENVIVAQVQKADKPPSPVERSRRRRKKKQSTDKENIEKSSISPEDKPVPSMMTESVVISSTEDSEAGSRRTSTRVRKKVKRFDSPDPPPVEKKLQRDQSRKSKESCLTTSARERDRSRSKSGKKAKTDEDSSAGTKRSLRLSLKKQESESTGKPHEIVSVKRKKQRGSIARSRSRSLTNKEETILYTILEPSELSYSVLEDCSTKSFSTRTSRSVISATSSDEEKPVRKSSRLLHKIANPS